MSRRSLILLVFPRDIFQSKGQHMSSVPSPIQSGQHLPSPYSRDPCANGGEWAPLNGSRYTSTLLGEEISPSCAMLGAFRAISFTPPPGHLHHSAHPAPGRHSRPIPRLRAI